MKSVVSNYPNHILIMHKPVTAKRSHVCTCSVFELMAYVRYGAIDGEAGLLFNVVTWPYRRTSAMCGFPIVISDRTINVCHYTPCTFILYLYVIICVLYILVVQYNCLFVLRAAPNRHDHTLVLLHNTYSRASMNGWSLTCLSHPRTIVSLHIK
jgi:hypothetical protein